MTGSITDRAAAELGAELATWRKEARRLAELAGWHPFGTHCNIHLEFDGRDDDGNPLWERPLRGFELGDVEVVRRVACTAEFMSGGDLSRFRPTLLRIADFLDRIHYDADRDEWACDQETQDHIKALLEDQDRQRALVDLEETVSGEQRRRGDELAEQGREIRRILIDALGLDSPSVFTTARLAMDLRDDRDRLRAQVEGNTAVSDTQIPTDTMSDTHPSSDPAGDLVGTLRIETDGSSRHLWMRAPYIVAGDEWLCIYSTDPQIVETTVSHRHAAGLPVIGAVPGTPAAGDRGGAR